ncbi:MAG: RagB/SusD family nutrient uptake outer membrane protein [Rhodothermales bacterium]
MRSFAFITAFVALLALSACDFTVENPGPVRDELLNDSTAFPAIVEGMERALGEALNWIAYTGAAISQEISPAGSIGNFGIAPAQKAGRLNANDNDTHWNNAQEARWVAESGIERMRERLGDAFGSDALAAEALIWSGFANRLLGENMCEAVIDGGASQPSAVYLERAEADFTEALDIARAAGDAALEDIALAGRASVRVSLGNWEGATADAAAVPEDLVFAMPYFDIAQDQYNRIFWANANEPYRAHSVVDTYYEDYYTETDDPRVAWGFNPDIPVGDVGEVRWLYQLKYDDRTSAIPLVTGDEMQLILAEAALREGNWQDALQTINTVRAEADVAPWEASSLDEAWTRLKRERGIVLWLEARRLGDLRRWTEDNTPGEMEDMAGRDLCFPIGQTEIETNTNL